jgi:hypothetical protein
MMLVIKNCKNKDVNMALYTSIPQQQFFAFWGARFGLSYKPMVKFVKKCLQLHKPSINPTDTAYYVFENYKF